jgi:hypothetical protein
MMRLSLSIVVAATVIGGCSGPARPDASSDHGLVHEKDKTVKSEEKEMISYGDVRRSVLDYLTRNPSVPFRGRDLLTHDFADTSEDHHRIPDGMVAVNGWVIDVPKLEMYKDYPSGSNGPRSENYFCKVKFSIISGLPTVKAVDMTVYVLESPAKR